MGHRFTLGLTLLIVGGLLIAPTSSEAAHNSISQGLAKTLCSKHGGLTGASGSGVVGCDYVRNGHMYGVTCSSGKCNVVSTIKPGGGGKPIHRPVNKPIRRPVKVGVGNPATKLKTGSVGSGSNHAGMNQSSRHRR